MSLPAHVITLPVLLGLAAASAALAIGSGSGGSVTPSCTTDTWACTDWSACGSSGTQTRNCSLTYDCPSVNTPEPSGSQTCTPASPANPPAAAPAVVPAQPTCTATAWQCTPWTQACDIYGQEHRTCRVAAECPQSPTPSPLTTEPCSHLQCGNLASLSERINCRLNLAPEGNTRELQIQYLPEECRALPAGTERTECVARYKAYAPCWGLPAGEGRFSCARQILKLGPSVAEAAKQCQSQTGSTRATCEQTLKEKVLYLIKFRFYDLEQRAEDLARRGADLGAVVKLETAIETKKQEFNTAKSYDQLRQIISDVRTAWQNFVSQVITQVH